MYLHVGLAAAIVTASPGATSTTGNFFEALVGALLVDGGYEAVQAFFDTRLESLIVERLRSPPQNYRSILANYASGQGRQLVFALADASRPREGSGKSGNGAVTIEAGGGEVGGDGGDEADGMAVRAAVADPTADRVGFHRVALLDGEEVGSGWGRNLKAADMAAAERAFALLRARGYLLEAAEGVDLSLDDHQASCSSAPAGEGGGEGNDHGR